MGLKIAGNVGKAVLIAINIIFLLIGIGLMTVGIIMRTNADYLFEDEIIATLNEITLYGYVQLGNLITGLSVYVIILGVFILIVSACGLLGACFQNKILLIVYAIVIVIIFIANCVAVGLWIFMKDKIDDTLRTELFGALEYYDGVDATDDKSIGIDLIQCQLKCCGSNDISNSKNSDEFDKSNSKWYKNKRNNVNEKVPPSCCKGANKKNYKTYTGDTACQEDLTAHNEKGCSKALQEETEDYQVAGIVVGVISMVIEILAFIFALLMVLAIGADKMV